MPAKKLKILFVIPYFAPAWAYGGPAKLVYDMGRYLVKRGHKVTVYASDTLDEEKRIPKKRKKLEGMDVHYLPNLSNYLAWRKIFLPQGLPGLLAETIADFDLVHLMDFRTYQNVWASYYAKRNKVPYFLSVLGQLRRGYGPRRPIKHLYDLLWGYNIAREATFCIGQNENEVADYKKFGVSANKVALVPLGIDFAEFEKFPPKGIFRKKFGFSSDDKIILFLGRIHEFKGLDFLIKGFAKTAQKVPNAKLAIVGRDDGYLEQMNRLIKSLKLEKKTIFLGPIYAKERISAYLDADIYSLTPSHFEETSLAALEACACQTPIVITQETSTPFLDQYKAGIMLKKRSTNELADTFTKLLGDETRLARMGDNARRMIREKFVWEKVTDQLESVYAKGLKLKK